MKKIIILLLLCSTVTFAQKKERIKAFKIAHITEALDLTTQEAEKFWPIYNVHDDKMHGLRRTERKEIFEVVKRNMEQLTESEAENLIQKSIEFKSQELQLVKDLMTHLKGVIPAKKIIKLHRAEDEFKRMLIKKMRERRGERGPK